MKGKPGVKTTRSATGTAALAVAAVMVLLPGCERKVREAIGDRNQIMVYSDEQNWSIYGPELEKVFRREVYTPRPELIFWMRHLEPDAWKFLPRFKNLVICAPLEDLTPTAEKVRALLSPEVRQWIYENKRALHVVQEDPYTRKQLFLIITADTRERLLEYIGTHSETLYRLMEERLNERIADLIYRQDEQYALEDTLLSNYQFTMRVPWGFRMVTTYARESLIRMIKYGPERWFFAYWVPLEDLEERGLSWAYRLEELGQVIERGEDPDPVEIRRLAQQSWDFRDEITRNYFDDDFVLRSATTSTIVEFNGRWAIRQYGRWHIDEPFSGGPMVAYCFIDSETGRLWWMDGAVFYPNEPKETLLRQLDVMIRTFRTGPLAQSYIASIREKIDERR